jgi:FkbH-like protein
VEVDFKLISHLWSKGNLNTLPLPAYRALDLLNRSLAHVVNVVSILLAPVIRKRKLNRGFYHFRKRFVQFLHLRHGHKADGFLLQVVNPYETPLSIQVVIAGDPRRRGQPVFHERFELPPGFSEHWVPLGRISTFVDLNGPFEISLLTGNVEPALLYILCADFVAGVSGPVTQRFSAPAALPEPAPQKPGIKAVIWDLDNTVWNGVLVESEGRVPELRPGVETVLRSLDERGIVQSIASKNNHNDAWACLESHGLAELFLFPRINWGPKSQGVREIIKDFNIAADTIAFIDDQPFERGEATANIPGILTLPETVIPLLLQDPRFQGSTSSEARQRRLLYKDQARREEALTQYGGDYIAYLRDCGIEVDIHTPHDDERDRLQELVQRTNQMNFSGNRYSRGELDAALAQHGVDAYAIRCRDRYGDYGIVGFSLVSRNEGLARVIDLAFSCRVQAKHVEHAFLLFLVREYQRRSFVGFEVEFKRTDRNTPVSRVFDDLQFLRREDREGLEVYAWRPERAPEPLNYITVRFQEGKGKQ